MFCLISLFYLGASLVEAFQQEQATLLNLQFLKFSAVPQTDCKLQTRRNRKFVFFIALLLMQNQKDKAKKKKCRQNCDWGKLSPTIFLKKKKTVCLTTWDTFFSFSVDSPFLVCPSIAKSYYKMPTCLHSYLWVFIVLRMGKKKKK